MGHGDTVLSQKQMAKKLPEEGKGTFVLNVSAGFEASDVSAQLTSVVLQIIVQKKTL